MAVAGIAGASILVAVYNPVDVNYLPVCPLYQLTGIACPGCGLTRGFHALFHGDLITALDFNALIPVWAVIIAYVWVSLLVYAVRGRGLPMWPTNPTFLWTFFIVLFVFGVLRNIPVNPFTILFP
jgi:hypothetical protein